MSGHHDLGYKTLFAHPELVRELLAGFTPFGLFDALDPADFERVNPAYVSERFSERQDDIVWRVRIGGQWVYIYILLEFQARVDPWMALRMQVYVGLLYQDLVRRGELGDDGRLPPVLPLVFYNGHPPWSASLELQTMIIPAPEALARLQPRQCYFLIDQKRLDSAKLAEQKTILALLFRMELSETPDVLSDVLPVLHTWLLDDDQASLRRDVQAWVEQLFSRECNGQQLAKEWLESGGTEMERKFETWTEFLEDRGIQRGLEQGRAEGMQKGREEERARDEAAWRRTLEKILAKRFPAMPPGTSSTIAAAPAEQVQEWIARAVDADSIEALLGLAPESPSASP